MLKNVLGVLKSPFERNKLNQVIFFITGKCNLRCRHCFYWRKTNQGNDLTFEEIKKISENLPIFNFLLLSGGEPFLRREIVDIIRLFRKNNHILQVSIPTNGFLVSETIAQLKKILRIDSGLMVSVNFSIDGLEEIHDRTRGLKGSFRNVIRCLGKVSQLKVNFPNLVVNVNTAITAENFSKIPDLIKFIKSKGESFIDGHYFEIVRGEPPKSGMKKLDNKQMRNLYQKTILPYQTEIVGQRYSKKWSNFLFSGLARANFSFIYKTQLSNFFDRKPWPMPCVAGQSGIIIDHRGNLAACELRKPIANLKDEKYEVSKLIKSRKMARELSDIKKGKCFCTHVCFLTESMYRSFNVVFWRLPLWWIRNLL